MMANQDFNSQSEGAILEKIKISPDAFTIPLTSEEFRLAKEKEDPEFDRWATYRDYIEEYESNWVKGMKKVDGLYYEKYLIGFKVKYPGGKDLSGNGPLSLQVWRERYFQGKLE